VDLPPSSLPMVKMLMLMLASCGMVNTRTRRCLSKLNLKNREVNREVTTCRPLNATDQFVQFMGHGSLSIDPRSQTTYHNTPLNIPLTCRSLYIYTGRPLAHQEQPKLARPPSTRSFVHSMNTVKGSRGSLGFGIGLWSYSRPFLFYLSLHF
jgi:hypothetical protein